MAIISGIGNKQTEHSLKERLTNPELRNPGKSLHFFGNKPTIFQDSPPYTANVVQETIEQAPVEQVTIKQKLWQYRGGAAIIAAPGDVLPKIYGTTIIQGRVMWSSEPYLDNNGRPRLDVGYGLCQGVTDGYLRIYGGNDKKLLASPDSVIGTISATKYWKKLNFHDGALDQEKDGIILFHKVKNTTPNFHGLCYVVFKGMKLWKFNNTSPDLWFVIGRGIEEIAEDVYEEIVYSNTTTQTNNMTGLGNLLYYSFNTANALVRSLNLDTDAVSSLAIDDQKATYDALKVFKDELYDATDNGLKKWNGSSWDTVWDILWYERRIVVSPDGETMLVGQYTGFSFLWKTTDGASFTQITTPSFGLVQSISFCFNSDDNYTIYIVAQNKKIYVGNLDGGFSLVHTFSEIFNYAITSGGIVYKDDKIYFVTYDSGATSTVLSEYEISTNTYTTYVIESPFLAINYDIEIFQDKVHVVLDVGTNPIGNQVKVFDEDTGTFSELPYPSGYPNVSNYKLLKHNNRLYVGTQNGIFQQGE